MALMVELWRDGRLVSSHDSIQGAAEHIGDNSDCSKLWEIIDRRDTPEGVIVARASVLRSVSGWIAQPVVVDG